MSHNRSYTVCGVFGACLRLLLALPAQVQAGPVIGAQLGVPSLKAGVAGQSIRVSAFNDGPAVRADVYLAVQTPGGDFYSFTGRGWAPGIKPWLRSLDVPAGFSYPSTPVSQLPGLAPGTYRVYTAFAEPGTLDLLHLHEAPFAVFGTGSVARFGAVTLSEVQAVITLGGGRRVVTEVSASGSFIDSNRAFEVTRAALEGVVPELEQCAFGELVLDWSSLPDGLSVRTLDVGERIRLSATRRGRVVGAVDLPRDADLAALGESIYGLPAWVRLPAGVLGSQYRYTFSAPGGSGLGRFQVSVDGVEPLRLVEPDLATLARIVSSRDLTLTWRGGDGIGEVSASLLGIGYPKLCSVICRFVDDGRASVPTGVLGQLKACVGDGGFPGFGATVSLSIGRSRAQFFNTGRNELSIGVASVAAGVRADDLQLN